MLTITEENYLKAIYTISTQYPERAAGTNEVAALLEVKPATANAMLKRLKEKNCVDYKKYGKIFLTNVGERTSVQIIRKHRLWETFLHQTLHFSWEEVHEIAEQLEHIRSEKLIERLDEFLGYPKNDPHGEPIPDKKGKLTLQKGKKLCEEKQGHTCTVVEVSDTDTDLLKYLAKQNIKIGSEITVLDVHQYDKSMEVKQRNQKMVFSYPVASNIIVSCTQCPQ